VTKTEAGSPTPVPGKHDRRHRRRAIGRVPAGASGGPPLDLDGDDGGSVTEAGSEVILMAGIQDISNTLVEDFKLNDVLRIILETMYRAKGFKRVILCVRDARATPCSAASASGRMRRRWPRFNFSLAFTPDIFHAALSKGVDILISDTNDPKIAARIPPWYRKGSMPGLSSSFRCASRTTRWR
jgi:hypothetical protein